MHEKLSKLTISLLLPRWACENMGENTDLNSNGNVSKTMNVFQRIFNKLSNYMQVDRLYTCGCSLVMFKVYGNIGILKIDVFNFSGTERVKQNQK